MDYQAQLTQIYNRLAAIDATLAKLALLSYVNTVQTDLSNRLNSITGQLNTITGEVQQLQLTVSDILNTLRSQ